MTDTKKPLMEEALTGTSKNGSSEILGLKDRIERFTTAKTNQYKILNYLRDGSSNHPLGTVKKLHENLGGCGNYLVFKDYYTVGAVRLGKASFCKKHFLCQLCAIRRGCKQVESYVKKLEVLQAQNGNLRPFLLTYTVRNGDNLKERFEHLSASIGKLMEKRRNHLKKGTPTEFGQALGGVYSYEFTKSSKGWHPHVHMVILLEPDHQIDFPVQVAPKKHSPGEWSLLTPKEKKLEKQKWIAFNLSKKDSGLSKEWKKITGDSDIVDLRPIDGDPAMGFVEVFKYALKFSELSAEDNIDAYFELMNSSGSMPRFTGSFGLLWGVKVPDTLLDETFDDLPYLELFYCYTKDGYSLKTAVKKMSMNDQKALVDSSSPLGEVTGKPLQERLVDNIDVKSLLAIEKERIKNEKDLFGRELSISEKGNVVFDDNGDMVDILPVMTIEENMVNAIDISIKKYFDEDGERVFYDKEGNII
jgi:hypothetical protein